MKFGALSIDEKQKEKEGHLITEILYWIKDDFSAIYFTDEPCRYNTVTYGQPYTTHKYSARLQAIYIQKVYAKSTGKMLPIFELGCLDDYVAEYEYNDQLVIHMWQEMFGNYINQRLKTDHLPTLLHEKINDIKTKAMYAKLNNPFAKCNAPADSCYEEKLLLAVNEGVENILIKAKQHYFQTQLATMLSTRVLTDVRALLAIYMTPDSRKNQTLIELFDQEFNKQSERSLFHDIGDTKEACFLANCDHLPY